MAPRTWEASDASDYGKPWAVLRHSLALAGAVRITTRCTSVEPRLHERSSPSSMIGIMTTIVAALALVASTVSVVAVAAVYASGGGRPLTLVEFVLASTVVLVLLAGLTYFDRKTKALTPDTIRLAICFIVSAGILCAAYGFFR